MVPKAPRPDKGKGKAVDGSAATPPEGKSDVLEAFLDLCKRLLRGVFDGGIQWKSTFYFCPFCPPQGGEYGRCFGDHSKARAHFATIPGFVQWLTDSGK